METRNDRRGSLWRKWDLHLHTPTSPDYKCMSITNEDIIRVLKENSIAVAAITDHHRIEVDRIIELRELAGKELTILPGIELRSELGGTEAIHFIGIFPELDRHDLNTLWTKLSVKLEITEDDVKRKGDDRIYHDLADASSIIHELGGLVSIHAGRKANTLENITNALLYKQAIKEEIVENIDIFEVGREIDITEYRKKVMPNIGKEPPMVLCSDNHDIRDYFLKANCWIKADPCFDGLKQLLNEPAQRCFVGEIPPKLALINRQKTKYIDSITIKKNEGSKLDGVWFDVSLPLNNDFIAIIGNKGAGKSALSETIGLLGNTRNEKDFSFLTTEKFRHPKNNLSEHFTATLIWKSGDPVTRILNESAPPSVGHSVKYIPQNYLEKICNEIKIGEGSSSFDIELKSAIYSHVPDDNKHGQATLDSLLDLKTSQIRDRISFHKTQIRRINLDIVKKEEHLSQKNKDLINSEIKKKEAELLAIEKDKPPEVKKPEMKTYKIVDGKSLHERLEINEKEIKEINLKISKMKAEKKRCKELKDKIESIIQKLNTFILRYEQLKQGLEDDLQEITLDLNSIISLTINKKPLEDKDKELTKYIDDTDRQLDESNSKGVAYKLKKLNEDRKILSDELEGPTKEFEKYQNALKSWEEQKKGIVGDNDTLETLEYYKGIIGRFPEEVKALNELKIQREEQTKYIFDEIVNIANTYSELYEPVQKFIESHEMISKELDLNFNVGIRQAGFEKEFFDLVSRGNAGTFYGQQEGAKKLSEHLSKHDFSEWQDLLNFVNWIFEALRHDLRQEPAPHIQIDSLLKKGKTLESLYNFIYSLEYLEPQYMLQQGRKSLTQLSPGERGTLLLLFYMLVDKDEIPLIIDQPEENLDNETVFKVLGPCIKDARKRRQVIIVTHNPNLAVACDADQIICASHDALEENRIRYHSGGIENRTTNENLLNVLEGTRPAFDNRNSKYYEPISD